MADQASVHWTQADAVARVVIDRPARFNAMTRQMWRDLKRVFSELNCRSDVRCVVLQGQGDHFCAGGDISEYPMFRHDVEALRTFHEEEVWGGLQAILDCDVPVIAAIRGNCMGAGVEMASCCDLRIATDDARFGAPIGKLGFPMAPREALLVAGALGDGLTRAMLLGAQIFKAERLLGNGFLCQTLESLSFDDAVERMTEQVLSLSTLSARLNKQTLRALAAQGLSDAVLDRAYDYAAHEEHREGIAAFLEKRPPRF